MKNAAVTLMTAALLGGCASTALVTINSLSKPSLRPGTYVMAPLNNGVESTDLQFGEYARLAACALAEKGYTPTMNGQKPDYVVLLGYGIGNPRTNIGSVTVPVWGQTGVSGSTTTGSVSNSGQFSATTTHVPTYGVTGYDTTTYQYTTYTRFVVLNGYDAADLDLQQKATQVFETTIVSEGTSGDLREMVPVLLGAALPHIAENTGKSVDVRISRGDARIDRINCLAGS